MAATQPYPHPMRRLVLLLCSLALVVTACGDDSAGGDLDAQLEALIEAAEDARGLEFIEHPEIVILPPDELADRIRQQVEEELDPLDVEVTQRLYELLGLLDGSIDLGEAYADLYAEGVVGQYMDDTGELLVAGGEDVTALSKTVVVHEMIHALTDQHFGFATTLDTLLEEERYHEASALQALLEGDATYYQLVYMQTLPTEEQVAAIQESLGADLSVMESLPDWFGDDLTWPYDAGFRFVQQVVEEQDVSGLNQAYSLLPTTTEQIIHPGTYFTRQPAIPVELPVLELAGYEIFEEGEFGEWNLQLLLLDKVAAGEAVVAAAGWGGDDYRVYWNGSDVAFAYLYEGDSTDDTAELAGSLARSMDAAMAVGDPISGEEGTVFGPGDDYAATAIADRRMLFVAASDPTIGESLFEALREQMSAP